LLWTNPSCSKGLPPADEKGPGCYLEHFVETYRFNGRRYHREWKDPLPLDRAIQYIERNYSSKIKIPQIADYAGVTPTHLSRLFNRRFDTTVIAYVRRKRVSEAVYYLTHTNLPIKEVAYRVGVEDLSHFYKIVHKELNSTPHEIRLKALEGNSFA
jgi:AraC-like DNA-binding protein